MTTPNEQNPNPTLPQESPEGTTPPTSTTDKPASLVAGTPPASEPPLEEWKEYEPDPNKSAEENAAAKADHDAKKPAEGEKKEAAPEPLTVEAIKLPEGFEVDQPVMENFLGLLNDDKLSRNELAQKLVDLQIEAFQQASERASSEWDTLQTKWQEEVKTDSEVGGPKLERTLAEANRIVDQLGTPELKAVLATTGIGNNVHFVRWLTKIAPFVTEAPPVSGTGPGSQSRYTKDNLYPDQK